MHGSRRWCTRSLVRLPQPDPSPARWHLSPIMDVAPPHRTAHGPSGYTTCSREERSRSGEEITTAGLGSGSWQNSECDDQRNALRKRQSRLDSRILLLQALGKGFQIRNATGKAGSEPCIEFVSLALANHGPTLLCQSIRHIDLLLLPEKGKHLLLLIVQAR